jgi:hypothetical protein
VPAIETINRTIQTVPVLEAYRSGFVLDGEVCVISNNSQESFSYVPCTNDMALDARAIRIITGRWIGDKSELSGAFTPALMIPRPPLFSCLHALSLPIKPYCTRHRLMVDQ